MSHLKKCIFLKCICILNGLFTNFVKFSLFLWDMFLQLWIVERNNIHTRESYSFFFSILICDFAVKSGIPRINFFKFLGTSQFPCFTIHAGYFFFSSPSPREAVTYIVWTHVVCLGIQVGYEYVYIQKNFWFCFGKINAISLPHSNCMFWKVK